MMAAGGGGMIQRSRSNDSWGEREGMAILESPEKIGLGTINPNAIAIGEIGSAHCIGQDDDER